MVYSDSGSDSRLLFRSELAANFTRSSYHYWGHLSRRRFAYFIRLQQYDRCCGRCGNVLADHISGNYAWPEEPIPLLIALSARCHHSQRRDHSSYLHRENILHQTRRIGMQAYKINGRKSKLRVGVFSGRRRVLHKHQLGIKHGFGMIISSYSILN